MRKLKLQMQLSADGFVARPDGGLDFMQWSWDDGLKNYVRDLTEPIDDIVMGRNLALGFIPHWLGVKADPSHPEYEAGIKFTDTPKLVFSQSLQPNDPQTADWRNATIVKGDLVTEINKLKNQPGKDIMTYGGAGFASSLIQHNLIDEYHLFINPTAIGAGLTIFGKVDNMLALKLEQATSFDCGVVVLKYAPAK